MALYDRRVAPEQWVSQELARRMTEMSRALNRQLGVMIDRRGRVSHVIVGDAHQLFIPDLTRQRAGSGRFRGIRLVHTHLRGEGLSEDDLTDLSLLRLDAVVVIQAQSDGLPGFMEVGTIRPDAPMGSDEPWSIERKRALGEFSADFIGFIEELERVLASTTQTTRVPGAEGAIVIGVSTHQNDESEASLEELERLADTAGLQVLDRFLQRRRKPDHKFVIGKGKLQEILVRAMQLDAEVLIFDSELAPSQLRNIATDTELKVVDRTSLILDIFSQRAKTREGKLQVELAQLRYRKPRLALMPTAMSRLTGGIGGRGPGETKLEINRRRADERQNRLEKQLRKLSKQRSLRRSRRRRVGLPQVAIIGYTNAGKSTLLNRMTRSDVDAEDKLFATLDPTSRRLRFPEEREVILTDTVGFIRQLPKDLIHAFRSTLEEVQEADLLVHVIDSSSPHIETHVEEVEQTIESLGAGSTPVIRVLNKIDAVGPDEWVRLKAEFEGMLVSAHSGEGLGALMVQVERHLFREHAQGNLSS
ncbi:MAG: GTPase HflX [Myxococcota bacterium]|nr:GTPase HflX [Myxococcota bacterium]